MELTKPDLTKLLAYMEGELQAKDVVIATLKVLRLVLSALTLHILVNRQVLSLTPAHKIDRL
jgi:hypothetical protein